MGSSDYAMKKVTSHSRQYGFTLIEVMVALVIVGIALPAMLLRMQSVIDHSSHMTRKTYAYWFAENIRQEMLLTQKLQGNVAKTKKKQDTEEFAGQEWHWKMEMKEVGDIPGMYQMDISVGVDQDEILATLSGFIYEQ
ncbi:MAG: type II secretion system minor pseudopilin GspI [Agarilytica sp.]